MPKKNCVWERHRLQGPSANPAFGPSQFGTAFALQNQQPQRLLGQGALTGAQRRQSNWTAEEDRLLLELVKAGKSWVFIAGSSRQQGHRAGLPWNWKANQQSKVAA